MSRRQNRRGRVLTESRHIPGRRHSDEPCELAGEMGLVVEAEPDRDVGQGFGSNVVECGNLIECGDRILKTQPRDDRLR